MRNGGSASRSTGSIGSFRPPCRLIRAARLHPPIARNPSDTNTAVRCAKLSPPTISAPNASISRIALSQSNRPPFGKIRGSENDAAKAAPPSGRLIRNSHCQDATDSTAAATVGPSPTARPSTAPLNAMPRPSRLAG